MPAGSFALCTGRRKLLCPWISREGIDALAQQGLRAVKISEQRVQHLRALRDAGLDLGPVLRINNEWQYVKIPRAVLALGVGVHVVGDAAVLDLLLNGFAHLVDVAVGGVGNGRIQLRPVGAWLSGRGEQLVESAFRIGIGQRHGPGSLHGAAPSQVQRQRMVGVARRFGGLDAARRVAHAEKARKAAGLGLSLTYPNPEVTS